MLYTLCILPMLYLYICVYCKYVYIYIYIYIIEFGVWQARVNTIHLTGIPWVHMSLPFWLKGLTKLANLFVF